MRKVLSILAVCGLLLAGCSGDSKADLAASIGAPSGSLVDGVVPAVAGPCAGVYQEALDAGLGLPNGWRLICPGLAQSEVRQHWGITCFGGVGPEGSCPYISINLNKIGNNPAKLKYVVFHELCHSQGNVAERSADQCAFTAGASSRYTPY